MTGPPVASTHRSAHYLEFCACAVNSRAGASAMAAAEDYSVFLEFGAADFSSCRLQWKELCLVGISGMAVTERGNEERTVGGGFRYQGSAMLSSPCRNRSIVW